MAELPGCDNYDPETEAYLRCDFKAVLESPHNYRKRLIAYFQNHGQCPADAEDCAQETSILLVVTRPQFNPKRGPLNTWAFTLARSVLSRFCQAKGRQPPPIDLENFLEGVIESDAGKEPDEHRLKRERLFGEIVRAAMSDLSFIERVVFVFWMMRKEADKIERAINVRIQNIYEIKHRIINKLKNCFSIE
jgi:RNA polymerase sigma factor (sigma-70 family)